MNKIICDICGSVYPETADQCPICGSSREFAIEESEFIPEKMPEYVPDARKKTGLFSSAAKMTQEHLYEMDAPEFDPPMDILPDVDAGFSVVGAPKRRVNYYAIILLSLLIGASIIASAFLFFRYFLPNQLSWETEPRQNVTQETETEIGRAHV